MNEEQAEQVLTLLTEIRDELRNFVRLMQDPGPAPEHVHAPADGSSPAAAFWVCKCGFVYDNERTS